MIILKLRKGKTGGALGFKTIKILIPNMGHYYPPDLKPIPFHLCEADGELTTLGNEDLLSVLEDYLLVK